MKVISKKNVGVMVAWTFMGTGCFDDPVTEFDDSTTSTSSSLMSTSAGPTSTTQPFETTTSSNDTVEESTGLGTVGSRGEGTTGDGSSSEGTTGDAVTTGESSDSGEASGDESTEGSGTGSTGGSESGDAASTGGLPLDCAGVPGGDAALNDCGRCVDDSIATAPCLSSSFQVVHDATVFSDAPDTNAGPSLCSSSANKGMPTCGSICRIFLRRRSCGGSSCT